MIQGVHRIPVKEQIRSLCGGILNSYSQVFFSNNRIFALILLVVTFFDFNTGLAGLLAVLTANGTAYITGFNRANIRAGYYGFNSLLVGLGLGVYYSPGLGFYLVLLFASVFTLFVTVMLEGVVGKYGLPYLSLSFLAGLWTVSLAAREFTALEMSEQGIFIANEMYTLGGRYLAWLYNWFSELDLPEPVVTYFRSLGAIFFQYHMFPGILIALGILIYSRIAFFLSLLGFFSAYLFYEVVGGDIRELSYSYIGFNFILTAIAIGGFFLIPSSYSYLSSVLLTPLISIIIISSMIFLGHFQLSTYSLPFNVVVLMFLYILKFRERHFTRPEPVIYQQFSPERNLYVQLSNHERFRHFRYIPLSLPFWGEWSVTQGQNDEITHQGAWAHAWDFEILDESGSSFKGSGTLKGDYYCYNKPVIAPADGWVEEIIDGIEDNEIGDINMEHNWGNTLVIRHAEKVFTQISHLKKNSFRCERGDFVKMGDILAYCGNSGRSPVPHLHFQVQETPYTGSVTLDYPLGNYILHRDNSFQLITFGKPGKGEVVSNIHRNSSLYQAFHFIPGQSIILNISTDGSSQKGKVTWEVETDIFKNTSLKCRETGSRAYFTNQGGLHRFTHFTGDRKSMLYFFYLGAYMMIPGFYKGLQLTDTYPVYMIRKPLLLFLQDFIAPFYIFLKSEYRLEHTSMADDLRDSRILMRSCSCVRYGPVRSREINFEIDVLSNRIERFVVREGNKTIVLSSEK
ncbi:MAG: urea transporter [Bacteroidales bacterium]|nr:urea transporter [Bacteroidales bacterium]